MDPESIAQYLMQNFDGLDVLKDKEDLYIYYDPGKTLAANRRMPFVTIMTTDAYDRASNLTRPGVYRVNIGVNGETYRKMFGPPPTELGDANGVDTGHDYTALDQIMPHPVYAAMSWVCVVNPSEATFEKLRTLFQEAYEMAANAFTRRMSTVHPVSPSASG